MGNSRLDLIRRKNAGKVQRADYAQKLRNLGVHPDLADALPLEESDSVRARSNQSFVGRQAGLPSVVERKLPLERLEHLGELIPVSSDYMYIIPWNADTVGVFKWPASVLNTFWKGFLKIDPDGLIVINCDFTSKIVVQVVDEFGEQTLDFAVWGDAWTTHLLNDTEHDDR